MLHSWFGSKSTRYSAPRQALPDSPPALDNAQPGPSDASSVSQSLQTPGNLTSSDLPLDEAHAHINDLSVYTHTPSLIHSADKEAGTSEAPTTSLLDAPTYPHVSNRISSPGHHEGIPFTPQDAILAQVFGKSVPSAPQPEVSLTTFDAMPLRRPGPMVTVYDPFSGVKVGEQTSVSLSTVTPRDPGPSNAAGLGAALTTAYDDRKLWSSLERILELQAEIAAMHADMEGVGKGSGGGPSGGTGVGVGVGAGEGGHVGSVRRRSRRGQTLPIGDEETEEHTTGLAVSEISTDHSEGEDEGGDEDDEDDMHGYGRRRRDEEFARLAEQFRQRKAAIGGIMGKLDDLSMALKTFHTLPPPLFDLAVSPSRAETMSSIPSNGSAPSSPPLHEYSGQPSSPPSSDSHSQAGPVTPMNVSLALPVPPLFTLAHPTPSEDPNAPPGLDAVAPVLPRIPRIIPGAPHVESPADMNPPQIFQGVS